MKKYIYLLFFFTFISCTSIYGPKTEEIKLDGFFTNYSKDMVIIDNVDVVGVSKGRGNVDGIFIDNYCGTFAAVSNNIKDDIVYWTVLCNAEAIELDLMANDSIKIMGNIYSENSKIRWLSNSSQGINFEITIVGDYTKGIQTNILTVGKDPTPDYNKQAFFRELTKTPRPWIEWLEWAFILTWPTYPIGTRLLNGLIEDGGRIIKLSRAGRNTDLNCSGQGAYRYKFVKAFDTNKALYRNVDSGQYIGIVLKFDPKLRPKHVPIPSTYYPDVFLATPVGMYESQGNEVGGNSLISTATKDAIMATGHFIGGNYYMTLASIYSIVLNSRNNNTAVLSASKYSSLGHLYNSFFWDDKALVEWGLLYGYIW